MGIEGKDGHESLGVVLFVILTNTGPVSWLREKRISSSLLSRYIFPWHYHFNCLIRHAALQSNYSQHISPG